MQPVNHIQDDLYQVGKRTVVRIRELVVKGEVEALAWFAQETYTQTVSALFKSKEALLRALASNDIIYLSCLYGVDWRE